VAAVGVFVNTPNEAIEAATRIAGFHMVQLHGNESPQQARDSRAPVIKAFRYFDALPADIWAYPPAHTLLDKGLPGKWGGTGERIDWRILSEQLDPYPDLRARLILAGGLTPENVEEAVRIVRPAAVDVSGGVENEPGRKSPAKIKEFMHVVRSLSCERLHA
jgi:phosphoribosylanthranilate isomerase